MSVKSRTVSLRCSSLSILVEIRFRKTPSVDRFVVFESLPNLLNGLSNGRFEVFDVVPKSILLSTIVEIGRLVAVVVRLRFGLVVEVCTFNRKSRLLLNVVDVFGLFVVDVLVAISLKSMLLESPGVGESGGRKMKLEVLGVELNGLSFSAKKSPTLGSIKLDDEKSASLWKGSRSAQGLRFMGARMPLPHLVRSLLGNSDGTKACGCKKLELPRLRQRICEKNY